MRGARFTRGGKGNKPRERECSPTEVWLSLWDGEEMEGCAALQRGGNFWVGSGEGCEIKLDDMDIGRKHTTGIRVDEEGIVWITDMGGRGGTRMIGDKLTPHSERRLCGNDFWCGRKGRHFRISRSIPSPGDFLAGDSSGGDGRVGRRNPLKGKGT